MATATAKIEHSGNAVTMSKDAFEDGRMCVGIVSAIEDAAKIEASDDPSPTGAYIVGVLVNGDGSFPMHNGQPVVFNVPMVFGGFDPKSGAALMHYPDQQISPKQAAKLAGVNLSTVQRAVTAGNLPEPNQLSPRRVGHSLADVARWIRKRG